MNQRSLGIILVAVGVAGLIGTAWASGAVPGTLRGSPTCSAPALPGQTVDVTLSDMGGGMGGMMMNGRGMMNVSVGPSTVDSGDVSFRVRNTGMMVHELVVLTLPSGGAGTRSIGSDGKVSEVDSLGEASTSCGEGSGDGIGSGAESWVTVHLAPGRYELVCNLPWHYSMGMFTELDVR